MHARPSSRRSRGITLIAVMVGVSVGFIIIAAVFSGFGFFEGQRRQMTGGDGALQNTLGGISEIQRSVKAAGSSITRSGQLFCPSINIYYDGRGTLADGVPIAPVAIADGGSGSDTLTVAFGSSLFASMPIRIVEQMPNPSAILKANAFTGLAVGDLFVIGTPGTSLPCSLMQVTHLATTGQNVHIQHNPGQSGPWNPPNPRNVFSNAPDYPAGSVIARIGTLQWVRYQVRAGRLEAVDLIAGTTAAIAEHVVALKAAYGTVDGTNRAIEQWVSATDAWANPSALQIAAIRAVRLGVVLRNPEHVKSTRADGACDASATQTVSFWQDGPSFDLDTLGEDWRCFKYRTFTLVVPLRNVIYGGAE